MLDKLKEEGAYRQQGRRRQGVAGLGALDVERPGLRVDEPQVDLLARQVVDAAQHAAERVVGPEPQRGPGLMRIAARRRRRCRRTARGSACTR